MLSLSNTALVSVLLASTALATGVLESVFAGDYDPMRLTATNNAKPIDLTIQDPDRKREIPIRIYLPGPKAPSPVVLFSHGLGGARTNNAYLGKHWSARGYVVIFLQHHGSDEEVWQDVPLLRRRAALKKAASLQSSLDRYADVSKVLDQLQKWNVEEGHVLSRRMDLENIGMSGHSFGAVTTQGVCGQTFPIVGRRHTDPRLDAALAFSPSVPRLGNANKAFGEVSIPWMLMTGTHDSSPINDTSAESRQRVYASLPKNLERYELVLHNAEHSAFSDRKLPGERLPRNPNHHRAILALSTAFWDAQLKEEPAAKTWLRGADAKTVLEEADRWQHDALTAK